MHPFLQRAYADTYNQTIKQAGLLDWIGLGKKEEIPEIEFDEDGNALPRAGNELVRDPRTGMLREVNTDSINQAWGSIGEDKINQENIDAINEANTNPTIANMRKAVGRNRVLESAPDAQGNRALHLNAYSDVEAKALGLPAGTPAWVTISKLLKEGVPLKTSGGTVDFDGETVNYTMADATLADQYSKFVEFAQNGGDLPDVDQDTLEMMAKFYNMEQAEQADKIRQMQYSSIRLNKRKPNLPKTPKEREEGYKKDMEGRKPNTDVTNLEYAEGAVPGAQVVTSPLAGATKFEAPFYLGDPKERITVSTAVIEALKAGDLDGAYAAMRLQGTKSAPGASNVPHGVSITIGELNDLYKQTAGKMKPGEAESIRNRSKIKDEVRKSWVVPKEDKNTAPAAPAAEAEEAPKAFGNTMWSPLTNSVLAGIGGYTLGGRDSDVENDRTLSKAEKKKILARKKLTSAAGAAVGAGGASLLAQYLSKNSPYVTGITTGAGALGGLLGGVAGNELG